MSLSFKNRGRLLWVTAALIVAAVIVLLFGTDEKTNRANIAFLSSYGWEVEEEPEEISHLLLPDTLNPVLETYQTVVKAAGFDLLPYRGMRAVRYTYRVKNHRESASGQVVLHVFTVKNEIIAADLCSFLGDGFLLPVNDTSGQINPLSY